METSEHPVNERIRHIDVSASSSEDAVREGLKHFSLNDADLLNLEVIGSGKKKFLVFGPTVNTYRVTVKPEFKRLITPLLANIFEIAHLELDAEITESADGVKILLTGNDVGLLFRNRCELLNAFETVIRRFLGQKLMINRDTKITVMGPRKENSERPERAPRSERSERSERRQPRRNGRRNEQRTYRKNPRENELKEMAKQCEIEITQKREPIMLEKLTASDRRIIHQYFEGHPEIQTTSLGEGQIKTIEISLR